MNVCYIILAHKNPLQLKRLVKRLYEPWTYFYIHIDCNINIIPFKEALKEFENMIFLENDDRYPGIWGDIGIVKGTLSAMRRIVKDKKKGYTVLLSGQDYPLETNNNILRFFEHNETNFIDNIPIETLWEKHGRDRITKYKINKSNKRGDFLLLPSIFNKDFYSLKTIGQLNYLRKTGKFKSLFKILKKREFPGKIKPFGGSQWWTLTNTTCIKILDFIREHPDYLEYHKYSLLPDEFFFQSIISCFKEKENLETKKSITYVNWKRKLVPLPVTFEKSDFDELREASKNHFFARKFDLDKDSEILDKIDSELLS